LGGEVLEGRSGNSEKNFTGADTVEKQTQRVVWGGGGSQRQATVCLTGLSPITKLNATERSLKTAQPSTAHHNNRGEKQEKKPPVGGGTLEGEKEPSGG